jgi:trehalose/maltose transport system substrate-binding protein
MREKCRAGETRRFTATSRAAALLLAFTLTFASSPATADTIAISCSAVGREAELCKQGAEAWAKKNGHQVKLVSTPNGSNERLALYQQLFAAKSADVDVFQIDVIWPGLLAQHLVDLKAAAGEATKDFLPALIANNTVAGRLVAMPWFIDVGLLYYRKDLLEKHGEKVPQTWQALAASAKKIQDAERAAGNAKMWGYVWQGRAYEGLTCNALEWIASHNGGAIVDAQGKITINNKAAIAAIAASAAWIDLITPKGVLNYGEEEARGVFQSGNAVFMRNWPYAYALANASGSATQGKVGVTLLPKGGEAGRHAAALGGQHLAVSKYSKHPDAAASLVMFLTSAAEQKRRAVEASFNPALTRLYQDPEVLAANPFFALLAETLVNAVPRPAAQTRAKYNQVSAAFWNAVHRVLSGKETAQASVESLEKQLQRLSAGGRW